MVAWQVIIGMGTIIGVTVGIIVLAINVYKYFNKLEQQIASTIRLLAIVCTGIANSSAFDRIDKGMMLSALAVLYESFNEKITNTLELIKQRSNPVTKEEIESLEKYRNMIARGMKFDREQAEEFKTITDKIIHERPNDLGAILLSLAAGIILGAIIGIVARD